MPAPTINTTTSVLGYRQHEEWQYQPVATDSPTSWACSTLPEGMSFSTVTGLLSGAATKAGVYLVSITATNGTGTSAAVVLTIGIEASSDVTDGLIDVELDVITGEVSLAGGGGGDEMALLKAKYGDDLLMRIAFVRDGTHVDLDIENLRLALDEYEPEPPVVESTAYNATDNKVGSGTSTRYLLHVSMKGDALAAALNDSEADGGTSFSALGEIEWTETNPTSPQVGPGSLVRSSQTFTLEISRDLAR